jgi:hypothetical protein
MEQRTESITNKESITKMKSIELLQKSQEYNFGYLLRAERMCGGLIARFATQIDAFHELFPEIELDCNAYSIKLNRPEREEMLAFLQCFGGDWEKSVSEYETTKMDYTQKVDEHVTLKVTYCPPPPNCQIVEEDVVIPAQAAHTVKKKVIRCTGQTTEKPTEEVTI